MQFSILSMPLPKVGAVNTVRIKRAADGRVLALDGFNTDYIGFYNSAKPMIDALGSSVKALILGTGGAAKAVAAVLADMGVEFKFVSRSRNDDRTISYDRLTDAIVAGHLFIVNTNSAGHLPRCGDLPADTLPCRGGEAQMFRFGLQSGGNRVHEALQRPWRGSEKRHGNARRVKPLLL